MLSPCYKQLLSKRRKGGGKGGKKRRKRGRKREKRKGKERKDSSSFQRSGGQQGAAAPVGHAARDLPRAAWSRHAQQPNHYIDEYPLCTYLKPLFWLFSYFWATIQGTRFKSILAPPPFTMVDDDAIVTYISYIIILTTTSVLEGLKSVHSTFGHCG